MEFYSPIYDTPEKIADEKPDIRTTLYWNPYLQIGPDGTAQIEFYSNDHKNQQYDIAIEGITPDGKHEKIYPPGKYDGGIFCSLHEYASVDSLKTAQQIGYGHTLFTGHLQFVEKNVSVRTGYFQKGFSVGKDRSGSAPRSRIRIGMSTVNLDGKRSRIVPAEFAPCDRIGTQSADQVKHRPAVGFPVDPTGVFEYFRRLPDFGRRYVILSDRYDVSRRDLFDRLDDQIRPRDHQFVMQGSCALVRPDRDTAPAQDISFVYLVVQHKGSDAALRLAVDNRPVDRRGPRYCGNNDACRLNVPSAGIDQIISGSIRKAITIPRSGRNARNVSTNCGSFNFSGCKTGNPTSTAYRLTADCCKCSPRPAGLSGIVTTPTT